MAARPKGDCPAADYTGGSRVRQQEAGARVPVPFPGRSGNDGSGQSERYRGLDEQGSGNRAGGMVVGDARLLSRRAPSRPRDPPRLVGRERENGVALHLMAPPNADPRVTESASVVVVDATGAPSPNGAFDVLDDAVHAYPGVLVVGAVTGRFSALVWVAVQPPVRMAARGIHRARARRRRTAGVLRVGPLRLDALVAGEPRPERSTRRVSVQCAAAAPSADGGDVDARDDRAALDPAHRTCARPPFEIHDPDDPLYR